MAESDRDLLDRSESRIQQLFLSRILHKGKDRWLYSDEICEILRNPNGVAISKEPAVMPPSGSIFVFDKKVQKHFRNDGYQWKKAKDGRTKEGHEKLKVEGLDTLHCYYAHGKEDQSLQRRTYWMIEENLSHMVLVHYRVVKGEKRKARYIEETQTAEGVQHSRKTYEITSNCEKDNFDSSSFNPSNFQHSQATESACDGYHGGNTVTPGFLDSTHNGRVKQEEGDNINQVRKQPKVTCGQKVSATQSHSRLERIYLSSNDSEDETLAVGTAPHQGEGIAWNNPGASDVLPTIDSLGCDFQFNIPDSQSIIYTQQDDETTRLDAFHIANPTVAATSTIGPIHLNPYTIANVADQAHLPVAQPTATIGVDIAAATNKTATVGTAPPQGEVIAWNNPGASEMQATIDSLGCDFQFNIQDSQSIIYTQQDDETWDAFHIAYPTMPATSTIGPIHLNPYTIANVADQAHPPVPQPTATIQVDIAAATNKTAAPESNNPALVQSRPTSNANQDQPQMPTFGVDISAATNKTAAPESSDPALVQTRPTSNANQDFVQDVDAQDSQPTGTTGIVISATTYETAVSESSNHAFVQREPTSNANQDFAQDVVESHEFSEEAMSSHKKLHQLLDRASAPNTLPSSSSSTPTRDSQAIATVRAILEMDFIAMADEVQRTHMISGIQSLVDSNCLPTGTGSPIMDMLKQLEKSVPAYSEAYSEYDMGKNLTGQVEASKQLLQPTVQFCDSMEKELQELEEKKMKIEARQVAIRKEMHDTVKETEPKQARLTKLLQQQDQFKGKEGKLMTILDIGNGMWTTLKNTIHRHLPT